MPRGEVPPEFRCKAKSKTSGDRCKQRVVEGKAVCYYHGGASRAGIAAPRFKTGATSKYLPHRLLERFERSLGDPKALEQREELGVVEARMADLLEGIKEVEQDNEGDSFISVAWLRRMRSLVKRYNSAHRKKDAANAASALAELFSLIEDGAGEQEAWEEWGKWVAKATKIRESERKRKIEEQQMLSIEEVNVLMAAVTDTIKKHVTDKELLGALGGELIRLTNIRTGGSRTEPSRN